MVRLGVVVALAPPFARALEVRMHVARHQLVVPLRRLPIRPVVRQLHDDAEAAGALQQALDEGDRVVRRADAGGAAVDEPVERIGDAWRHDREGGDIVENSRETSSRPNCTFSRAFSRVSATCSSVTSRQFSPVRDLAVQPRLLLVKRPVLDMVAHRIGAGAADRQHADAVPPGRQRPGRRARRRHRQLHHRLRVAGQLQPRVLQIEPVALAGHALAAQQRDDDVQRLVHPPPLVGRLDADLLRVVHQRARARRRTSPARASCGRAAPSGRPA